MVNLALTRPTIPESATSGSRINESSPTPSERRIKSTYCLPESTSFGEGKPSHRPSLDDGSIKSQFSQNSQGGCRQTFAPNLSGLFGRENTEESTDLTSDENESMATFEDFEIEDISPEEMRYWSRLAPEDQKLAKVENLSIHTAKTPKGSLTHTTVVNQVALYIREHGFFLQHSDGTGTHTTSARREFERDVYDFARDLSLSKKDAKKQVIRARQFCGELEYDSDNSSLGNEVSNDDSASFPPARGMQQQTHAAPHPPREEDHPDHPDKSSSPHPSKGGRKSLKRKLPSEGENNSTAATSRKKRSRASPKTQNAGKIEKSPGSIKCKASTVVGREKGKRKGETLAEVQPHPGGSLDGGAQNGRQVLSDGNESASDGATSDRAHPPNDSTIEKVVRLPADRERRRNAKIERRREKRLQDSTASKERIQSAGAAKGVAATEPKSQSEAHENYVRATERDPHDGGPSAKKGKKEKSKSKEQQTALNAELRALNSEVNDRHMDDYDQGELKGASKAVKAGIEDAKAQKERIVEDEKAGRREVEKSMEAAAKKKRRERVSDEKVAESEGKSKKSRKQRKSKEQDASLDFPSPMIRTGTPVLQTAIDKDATPTVLPEAPNETLDQPCPQTPSKAYQDIDIEFPWTDSDLSSAPSSPIPPSPIKKSSLPALKSRVPHLKRRPSSKISPYFPTPPRPPRPPRSPRPPTSVIPFPPLSAARFGLIQETLAHHPFHLLLACIFLTKTRGSVAIPLFYDLIFHYPTPAALGSAELEDVVSIFQHLGLQNQRAKRVIALAKAWVEDPPTKGRRWKRVNYPKPGDGKDIKHDEDPIADDEEDARVAWEVGNLPGIGAYALDSWRIFCRDDLRGLASSFNPGEIDEESKEAEMEGEWSRVLPTDKELRAYLRWRWLRLGWEWDPLTGEKKSAREGIMQAAKGGGVVIEGDEGGKMEGARFRKEDVQLEMDVDIRSQA